MKHYKHLNSRTATLGPLCVLVLLVSCGPQATAPPASAPAVTVSLPVQQEITEWDDYVGRVAAIEEVEIRSQVTGFLDSIHFRDGQIVKKGDLLFIIDQRPFQAALDQAKAGVAEATGRLEQSQAQLLQARAQALQAKANQTKTQLDFDRFKPLAKDEAITQQDLDNAEQANLAALADVDASQARIETASAAVIGARALVEAAKARVQSAELNLGFTRIAAPVSGRIDRHLTSIGNLISGGSDQATLLTTIVSVDPAYVYFEVDERAYLKYARLASRGERPSSREVANPVLVGLADEEGFPHRGFMDFVENKLDVATSTIQGRARVPNPDRSLIPGLFVRVRLQGSAKYQAMLVPDATVGSNLGQKFVYIVNGKNEVEMRPVSLGPLHDGLRIVRQGIAASDRVVVAGVQFVRPGTKVQPSEKSIPMETAAKR
jgi:multidrug efflux system membrane fusion protein